MRVSVDWVEQGLEGVPIPVPSEQSRLLKHVHGSCTQWPKHSIILEQVKKTYISKVDHPRLMYRIYT